MEFPPEESEKEDKYIDLLLEEKDKRIKEKDKRIKRLKEDSREKERISALKDQIDNLRQTLRQKQQQIESLKENQITPEKIEEEIEDYIDLDAIEKLQKEKEELQKEIEHLKETDKENLDKIRELSRKNEELKKELKKKANNRKSNNNDSDPIIKKYRESHRTKKEEAALAVEDFFKNRDEEFKTPKIVEEIHGEKLKTSDSRYNRIREKLHKLVDEGKLERKVRKNTHFYSTTDSEEENEEDYSKPELKKEIPDVLENNNNPMSVVDVGKVFFGEDFTSKNVEYDRIYKALEELKEEGTVNKLDDRSVNKFKLLKEKDISNFQRSEVQEKMVEELQKNDILYSAKDLMEKIFDNKWISASKTEKQKIYNAVSVEDRIKSVKIQEKGQTVTKYQLEGFDFEEQKTRENYSQMIDGQPLYEHIKVAMGKVLPEKGDSTVVNFEGFTYYITLENEDQEFEVWQSLYTDNDLISTIKKDLGVEFDIKFTKKSSGTAVTAKHYQMEIYR